VGLSPEVCAELLDISITEFEGGLQAVLIERFCSFVLQ
jgi:hypothetical protein